MKVLAFFNLLDNDGHLSITNAAVYISMFKMATSHQMSGGEVGALVATLLNYGHKRFVNDGAKE